ncbi:SAM-dependent methyltransferase [Nocardiopsis quinghaiensis]|nr:SAM-dependent methyltransferase [Nocardiopsis quinghaiensis]
MTDAPAVDDTAVAHPARVLDYWLGGTEHHPADRGLDEQIAAHERIGRTR